MGGEGWKLGGFVGDWMVSLGMRSVFLFPLAASNVNGFEEGWNWPARLMLK